MRGHPSVSIVVPVLDGREVLPRCVEALEASDLPRKDWELIVVDDGSTDGTKEYAAPVADRLLAVDGGPRGPGWARNRGAEEARADTLVFVDADVCVHSDTLRRFAELLRDNPHVAAAFGTYDDEPGGAGFLSQYRNLSHRYVHLRGAGEAETFWAGCGAVRRQVFLTAGGFDADRYRRPQIEDIDLGYRLRDAGHRIVLDPAIQAKHLKHWTPVAALRTDLFDRGIPWVRLLLARRRTRPTEKTLNVRALERAKTALVGLACVFMAAGAVSMDLRWLVASAGIVATVVVLNLPALRWFAGVRGWFFAVLTVPLLLLYHLVSGVAVLAGTAGHLGETWGRSK